jgi:phospholipid-translocating ATPase
MFWFQIFNGFDATYLFEYTLLLLYNLVFTSLPVGILGALDQDTHATASLAFPQLYRRGMMGLDYTRTRFWLYMGDGLYQSAILFFIPWLCYGAGHSWASNAKDTNSLYDIGSTIAVAGVLAANVYVGINTRYWTVITWIVYVGSTLLVYIWIPIYSALAAFPYYGEVEIIYATFNFWFIVFFTVFCCVGPRWLVLTFRNSYMPRDKEIVREAWVAGDLKRELGLKKRRQIKAEKKARSRQASMAGSSFPGQEHDSPPTYHDADLEREIDLNMDVDMESGGQRYGYEPAGMSSPLRERPRSPLISESGTPRGPFSYPPSPARGHADILPSTTSYQHANAPPPLALHQQRLDATPPYIGTPTSGISYTSPTAIETMNLASDEIRRLSQASLDLRRSSLTAAAGGPAKRPSVGSRKGSRESWIDNFVPGQGPGRGGGSGSGSRRSSPPFTEGQAHQQSYPLAPIVSHEVLAQAGPDYGRSDAEWEQDGRRAQRDSTASGYGYAV